MNAEFIEKLIEAMKEIRDRLERLEALQGQERDLVSPTRSEEKPEHAEDLREGKRVSPGEAEAAIMRAIEWNLQAAAKHRLEAALACAERLPVHARFYKSRELLHSDDARALRELLPEPDSEACEIPAARPNQNASTEANTAAPTCDERSGRRNAKRLAHADENLNHTEK